jgi:hypothetical protein
MGMDLACAATGQRGGAGSGRMETNVQPSLQWWLHWDGLSAPLARLTARSGSPLVGGEAKVARFYTYLIALGLSGHEIPR